MLLLATSFLLFSNFIIICKSLQFCDADYPCSNGLYCAYDGSVQGVQVCQKSSSFKEKDVATVVLKKSGRCPKNLYLPSYQSLNGTGTPDTIPRCNSHQSCLNNRKCCPVVDGSYSVCIEPEYSENNSTKVTVLIQGSFSRIDSKRIEMTGSATLVQSKGFNVIVDTSNIRKKIPLLKALYNTSGLLPEDIDFIVTTHGHPDHYSNNDLFSNVPNSMHMYRVNGTKFISNTLNAEDYVLINGDPNLEARLTPGHSRQCISLIAKNVENYGIVSVVGDLFMFRDDFEENDLLKSMSHDYDLYQSNRRRIACISDYIVPGHGPMFQVDSDLKNEFNCRAGVNLQLDSRTTSTSTSSSTTPPTTTTINISSTSKQSSIVATASTQLTVSYTTGSNASTIPQGSTVVSAAVQQQMSSTPSISASQLGINQTTGISLSTILSPRNETFSSTPSTPSNVSQTTILAGITTQQQATNSNLTTSSGTLATSSTGSPLFTPQLQTNTTSQSKSNGVPNTTIVNNAVISTIVSVTNDKGASSPLLTNVSQQIGSQTSAGSSTPASLSTGLSSPLSASTNQQIVVQNATGASTVPALPIRNNTLSFTSPGLITVADRLSTQQLVTNSFTNLTVAASTFITQLQSTVSSTPTPQTRNNVVPNNTALSAGVSIKQELPTLSPSEAFNPDDLPTRSPSETFNPDDLPTRSPSETFNPDELPTRSPSQTI